MERVVWIIFLALLFFSGLGLFSMSFKQVLDVYFFRDSQLTLLIIGNLTLMLIGAAGFFGAIYLSRGIIYR